MSVSQQAKFVVLVYVARRYVAEVSDVSAMSRTCKTLHGHLDSELYRTDANRIRDEEEQILYFHMVKPQHPTLTQVVLQGYVDPRVNDFSTAASRCAYHMRRPNLMRPLCTALIIAAKTNNVEMARKALLYGVGVWPGYIDVKAHGRTALMAAVQYEQPTDHAERGLAQEDNRIITMLIDGGCFVDTWHDVRPPRRIRQLNAVVADPAQAAVVPGASPMSQNILAYSPLGYAVTMGTRRRPGQITMLASHAAPDDPVLTRARFRAGLVVARNRSKNRKPYVKVLPINPLNIAAHFGKFSVVFMLLSRGHSSHTRCRALNNDTPIESAAAGRDANFKVMILLDRRLEREPNQAEEDYHDRQDGPEQENDQFPFLVAAQAGNTHNALRLLRAQRRPSVQQLCEVVHWCVLDGRRGMESLLSLAMTRGAARGRLAALQQVVSDAVAQRAAHTDEPWSFGMASYLYQNRFISAPPDVMDISEHENEDADYDEDKYEDSLDEESSSDESTSSQEATDDEDEGNDDSSSDGSVSF